MRRSCVSYITGASNWYWLTVGQCLLSLFRVRVEGECFYFFCFFTFIPVPLSSLSLSFISSTLSSLSFLPFSGRRHKMTLKGWRVVKPQHNQSIMANSTVCQSKWKPIVEPRRAKPKTYRQAPTHWLKFYEETVIESEARTAVVQLKSEA